MDNEGRLFTHEDEWESGFEGDRRIVVARLGPFQRVFPQPKHYVRRFYHRVYDLSIQDWHIALEPIGLGPLCTVEATLSIRFQPTFTFAKEHLDHLDALGEYIKARYEILLRDAAESECRLVSTETTGWIQRGHAQLEHRVDSIIHEILAIRDIQSRCRCQMKIHFTNEKCIEEEVLSGTDISFHNITLAILRRRRDATERLVREQYEQHILEQTLKLEHEERMLDLVRQEGELRRQRQEQENERIRAERIAEETRYAEQMNSEIRLREERLRHETRMRQMEVEAELQEKSLRTETIYDVEAHLRREIELLAMERQRLSLEQEIHEAKVARSRRWTIGGKKLFPLMEDHET